MVCRQRNRTRTSRDPLPARLRHRTHEGRLPLCSKSACAAQYPVHQKNQSTTEAHHYLSSALPEQYHPPQWLGLIRGHWAGVEIRNHRRRDVIFGEDGSRSRNPNLLANLALIRTS